MVPFWNHKNKEIRILSLIENSRAIKKDYWIPAFAGMTKRKEMAKIKYMLKSQSFSLYHILIWYIQK
jgi:hypothetical protein